MAHTLSGEQLYMVYRVVWYGILEFSLFLPVKINFFHFFFVGGAPEGGADRFIQGRKEIYKLCSINVCCGESLIWRGRIVDQITRTKLSKQWWWWFRGKSNGKSPRHTHTHRSSRGPAKNQRASIKSCVSIACRLAWKMSWGHKFSSSSYS